MTRAEQIIAAVKAGERPRAVAERFGVTPGYVYMLVPGQRARNRAARNATTATDAFRAHGGNKRRQGGSQSRFVGTSAHANRDAAALPATHAAMREMRTLFPSTVVDARSTDRILVSGSNSAKLGSMITKGPWRGLAIYLITLEERRTCPASCHLLAECYGNAMHMTRRHRYDLEFVNRLDIELRAKALEHRQGFAVRLHALGDFPDARYVHRWARWLHEIPGLHVFGYTAHPRGSTMGRIIGMLNLLFSTRCAIRFSVAPDIPATTLQATTIWRAPATSWVAEGMVCPAQRHDADGEPLTRCCGTCGLCWSPAMADQRIVFIGHGMRGGRKPSHGIDEPEASA